MYYSWRVNGAIERRYWVILILHAVRTRNFGQVLIDTDGFGNTQVYTLEKVLKMKKDTVSGINFLDEAMKVIIN